MQQILSETMMGCIITSLILGMLCSVLQIRAKLSLHKTILVITCGVITIFFMNFIISVLQLVFVFKYIYLFVNGILLISLCILLFRCSLLEVLFLYFILQSYIDNSFMLAKSVQAYFFGELGEYKSLYLSYTIVTIMGLPPMVLILMKRMKNLVHTTEAMHFWNYIWIIPVSHYIVSRIIVSPKYDTLETVWTNMNFVGPLMWAISTMLSYVLIMNMLLDAVKYVKNKQELQTASQLLVMQKEQYQRLYINIEESKKIRHDMKHHMVALMGYAEKADIDGLKSYLHQYIDAFNSMERLPICEHYAIDSILQYYTRKAEQQFIKFTHKIQILEELKCTENEICVILGNLLDNALEACSNENKEHFVEIVMRTVNANTLGIIVSNSYDTAIQYDEGKLLSAKRDFLVHGVGLSSVQNIVDKYHGYIRFEYDGERCRVSILL